MLFEMVTKKMFVYHEKLSDATKFLMESITEDRVGSNVQFWLNYFKRVLICKRHERPSIQWCLDYFQNGGLSAKDFEMAKNEAGADIMTPLLDASVLPYLKQNAPSGNIECM
jgi:hypothetical protein